MVTVKIPDEMRPNWECNINGVKYSYPAGTQQSVPQEVADLIGHIEDMEPTPGRPAQGQSDWNQNNPSAPDYVKNRPFYTEMVEEIVLEGELEAMEEGGGFIISCEIARQPVDGEQMTVILNGVTNTVNFAYDAELDEYNATLPDGGVLWCFDTGSGWEYGVVVQTAATVKVLGEGEEVHKLNEKFLPDSVAGKDIKMPFDLGGFFERTHGDADFAFLPYNTSVTETPLTRDEFIFLHGLAKSDKYMPVIGENHPAKWSVNGDSTLRVYSKPYFLGISSGDLIVSDGSWFFILDEDTGVVTQNASGTRKKATLYDI